MWWFNNYPLLKTFRLPFCLTVFSSHLGHNCKQPLISQAPDDNLTGGASVCGNRGGGKGIQPAAGAAKKRGPKCLANGMTR